MRITEFIARHILRVPWSRRVDPIYEMIGMVSVSWAFIDAALNTMNFMILHRAEGDQIQSSLPVSLKPKIALFRKAHEQLPKLASLREDGLKLIADINAQKEHRHDLVHSFFKPGNYGLEGKRTLHRHVFDDASLSTRNITYSHDDAWASHLSAMSLARRCDTHMLRMADLLGVNEPDNIEATDP